MRPPVRTKAPTRSGGTAPSTTSISASYASPSTGAKGPLMYSLHAGRGRGVGAGGRGKGWTAMDAAAQVPPHLPRCALLLPSSQCRARLARPSPWPAARWNSEGSCSWRLVMAGAASLLVSKMSQPAARKTRLWQRTWLLIRCPPCASGRAAHSRDTHPKSCMQLDFCSPAIAIRNMLLRRLEAVC